MHSERFGFVFRMKLTRYEERMGLAWQFDDLDELSIRRYAAEDKAFFLKHLSELGIEFVTMSVAFTDLFRSVVNITSDRILCKTTLPVPQTHRSAVFLDPN